MSDAKVEQGTKGTQPRHRWKSPDEWMRETRLIIANAGSDAAIAARLASFGYDAARLATGQALYDEVAALVLRQKEEYGQRFEATEHFGEAWKKADEAYTAALKVARIALRDRTRSRSAMMVDGPRNRSLPGWLKQAEAFYGNLLGDPEALADMARFGYTADSLKAEQALLKDISAKDAASRKELGEALGFTKERDRKMDELARWVSDLRAIAKLAFKGSPDKLKILGI
jgi:hypothetical protein